MFYETVHTNNSLYCYKHVFLTEITVFYFFFLFPGDLEPALRPADSSKASTCFASLESCSDIIFSNFPCNWNNQNVISDKKQVV